MIIPNVCVWFSKCLHHLKPLGKISVAEGIGTVTYYDCIYNTVPDILEV